MREKDLSDNQWLYILWWPEQLKEKKQTSMYPCVWVNGSPQMFIRLCYLHFWGSRREGSLRMESMSTAAAEAPQPCCWLCWWSWKRSKNRKSKCTAVSHSTYKNTHFHCNLRLSNNLDSGSRSSNWYEQVQLNCQMKLSWVRNLFKPYCPKTSICKF